MRTALPDVSTAINTQARCRHRGWAAPPVPHVTVHQVLLDDFLCERQSLEVPEHGVIHGKHVEVLTIKMCNDVVWARCTPLRNLDYDAFFVVLPIIHGQVRPCQCGLGKEDKITCTRHTIVHKDRCLIHDIPGLYNVTMLHCTNWSKIDTETDSYTIYVDYNSESIFLNITVYTSKYFYNTMTSQKYIQILLRIFICILIVSSTIGVLMLLEVITGSAVLVLVLIGFVVSFLIGLMTFCAICEERQNSRGIEQLPIDNDIHSHALPVTCPTTFIVHIELEKKDECHLALGMHETPVIIENP